jgi:CubicO group peptidase (beta-lactamase class C family)
MRSLYGFLLPAVVLLTVCQTAWGQAARPIDKAAIDTAIRDALKAWQVPGVAVGIVYKGEIVYLKGHGIRSLTGSDPVTPDTVFPLASCSKAFTTTALALLADEGKLTWDDPVRKHLPTFHLGDPLADRAVTVRDLLCHRTGLASHDWLWYRAPWSNEEAIRRVGLLPLDRPFRTAYQYQSTMFTAAGLAAGNAAGMPWEDLVRKRLLEPLGMTRTVFTSTAAHDLEPAMGHRLNARGQLEHMPTFFMENPNPAGSIHSSARDLCRWLQFHLANGRIDGKQLVSVRNLGETHTPQMVVPMDGLPRRMHPETVQLSYGMGWVIQDYRGLQLQSHGGLIDGYRIHLTLVPREGLGIVLLNNLHVNQMNLALSNTLVDQILGLPRRDWNSFLLAIGKSEKIREDEERREREKARQPDTRPSLPLVDYIGRYEHPAFGPVDLTVEGQSLVLRWNRSPGRLDHFHFDTFVIREGLLEGARVQFRFGPSGAVSSMRIVGNGVDLDLPLSGTKGRKTEH